MSRRAALRQLARDLRLTLQAQRHIGVVGVIPAPAEDRALWEARQKEVHKARVARAAAALRGSVADARPALVGSAPVAASAPTAQAPASAAAPAAGGEGSRFKSAAAATARAVTMTAPTVPLPEGMDVWRRLGARPQPVFVLPPEPEPAPEPPPVQERRAAPGATQPERRSAAPERRGGSQARQASPPQQQRAPQQQAAQAQQSADEGPQFTRDDLPKPPTPRAPQQVGLLGGARDVPAGPMHPRPIAGFDGTEQERARLQGLGQHERMNKLRECLGDCRRCALSGGRTNIVFGDGDPAADVVFVGEAPGFYEDKSGIPFVGKSGELLNRMIKAMGLDRRQVYILNVLKCRPPNNRDPAPDEIRMCSPYLLKQLEILQPRVILTTGRFATQCLLDTQKPMRALRGTWQYWRDVPVLPTYHPAFLLRSPGHKREAWHDLQKVMYYLEHGAQS